MFAIALWDRANSQLLLVRDRLGIKPLYYAVSSDYLVFSSEIKGIIASGLVDPEIDSTALEDLFTLSYPCPPRTMFRGIRELPPAHLLSTRASMRPPSPRRYWKCVFPPIGEHSRLSRDEASEELLSLMKAHVYDHLISDVPVGVYLSGGLDSSAIAAVYREVTGDAPTTFTVAFDHPKFDESSAAREVGSFLGAPGYELVCGSRSADDFERMIWHTELPLQFPLAIPLMNLSSVARAHGFPVVLTGEGADEILGGYDGFRADKMRRVFDHPGMRSMRPFFYKQLYQWHALPDGTVDRMIQIHSDADRIRAEFGGMVPPWFDMWTTIGLDRDRLLGVHGKSIRSVWEQPSGFEVHIPDDVNRLHPLDASISLEMETRLPAWILLIADRASMASGVEARVPFLDHEIVEFVAALSPGLKLRRFCEKAILRDALTGILPAAALRRKKRPFFTPIREWFFADPVPDFVEDSLSPGAIKRAGMFDDRFVHQCREQLRREPAGTLMRHQLEWTLLLVLGSQVLHRQFVQHRAAAGVHV